MRPRVYQPLVVLHLFSGPRRCGDLEHWLQHLGALNNVPVVVYSLDTIISAKHDLLNNDLFGQLRRWCYSGLVFAIVGGFPCCTVSRARHRPGGPPPLRSRQYLFGLPGLSSHHRQQCDRGSELFLRTMDLGRGVTSCGGVCVLENPQDPGHAPYPSFWATPQWKHAVSSWGWELFSGDQCMYGSPVKKPTSLGGFLPGLEDFHEVRCTHGKHDAQVGWDPQKLCFRTAALAQYPSALNEFLARRVIAYFVAHGTGARSSSQRVEPWLGIAALGIAGVLCAAPRNVWPTGKGRPVLAEPSCSEHAAAVPVGGRGLPGLVPPAGGRL